MSSVSKTIDMMEMLRRVAISDQRRIWHLISPDQPNVHRPQREVISCLARTITQRGGFEVPLSNLAAPGGGGLSLSKMSSLENHLELIPADDSSAVAMIDEFLLRTLGDVNPHAQRLFIKAAKLSDQQLPLLDAVGEGTEADFSSYVLVGVQHLLGSEVALLTWLNRLGLPYQRMHLIGKIYSSNRLVVHHLRELGVNVHEASLEFAPVYDVRREYENLMRVAVADLFERAEEDLARLGSSGRLLILDDGAVAIEALRYSYPRYADRAVAVEQTRRGKLKIRPRQKELRAQIGTYPFPVVKVSDSAAKLDYEYPLIADSVITELRSKLRRHREGGALETRRVLVSGYGRLGRIIAAKLRHEGLRILVTDNDPETLNDAEDAKFDIADPSTAVNYADTIIGCAGVRTIPRRSHANIKPGTILASASSSNVEFHGLSIRSRARFKWDWSQHFEVDSPFQQVHSDYAIRRRSPFWLLNGGFPINFTGGVDPIDPKDIQVTRALMLAGACYASESHGRRGLISLPESKQTPIVDLFKSLRSLSNGR